MSKDQIEQIFNQLSELDSSKSLSNDLEEFQNTHPDLIKKPFGILKWIGIMGSFLILVLASGAFYFFSDFDNSLEVESSIQEVEVNVAKEPNRLNIDQTAGLNEELEPKSFERNKIEQKQEEEINVQEVVQKLNNIGFDSIPTNKIIDIPSVQNLVRSQNSSSHEFIQFSSFIGAQLGTDFTPQQIGQFDFYQATKAVEIQYGIELKLPLKQAMLISGINLGIQYQQGMEREKSLAKRIIEFSDSLILDFKKFEVIITDSSETNEGSGVWTSNGYECIAVYDSSYVQKIDTVEILKQLEHFESNSFNVSLAIPIAIQLNSRNYRNVSYRLGILNRMLINISNSGQYESEYDGLQVFQNRLQPHYSLLGSLGAEYKRENRIYQFYSVFGKQVFQVGARIQL